MSVLARRQYDLVHFDTVSLVPYRPLVAHTPATLNHHNIESHMALRRADNTANGSNVARAQLAKL